MTDTPITQADRITDDMIDAASEEAHRLASKIVLGNHGCGNAAQTSTFRTGERFGVIAVSAAPVAFYFERLAEQDCGG